LTLLETTWGRKLKQSSKNNPRQMLREHPSGTRKQHFKRNN
jgi:hypothetical protein